MVTYYHSYDGYKGDTPPEYTEGEDTPEARKRSKEWIEKMWADYDAEHGTNYSGKNGNGTNEQADRARQRLRERWARERREACQ